MSVPIISLKYMVLATAIHWAKDDIINSQLLSRQEIDEAIAVIDKNKIPYSNLESAFKLRCNKNSSK